MFNSQFWSFHHHQANYKSPETMFGSFSITSGTAQGATDAVNRDVRVVRVADILKRQQDAAIESAQVQRARAAVAAARPTDRLSTDVAASSTHPSAHTTSTSSTHEQKKNKVDEN